jgi:isomerase DpgB
VSRWERVLRRVERANAITVTLVEHACSALALELLLVSDRRLASSDFSVQCARTGKEVWPSMALYRLTREMGASRARKILLEHLKMSAQKAVELQIVDKIVNDEVTDAVCSEYLLHYAVAEGFPVCRRLMQDCLSTDFDDALGTHLAACDRVLRRAAKIECETAANVTPAV